LYTFDVFAVSNGESIIGERAKRAAKAAKQLSGRQSTKNNQGVTNEYIPRRRDQLLFAFYGWNVYFTIRFKT